MRQIAELHARCTSPGRCGQAAAAAAAARLQGLLMELALDDPSTRKAGRRCYSHAAVRRVAEILHDHYDQVLTVEALAQQADLSRGYLGRQFRDHYGMTIKSFLRRRRIEVAIQLLQTTDLPVKSIARRVGIADLPHFHRQFRAITGTTPARIQRDLDKG